MEVHETVERALATQAPFGDDRAILDGRRDFLIGQLNDLASALPEASRLTEAVAHRDNGDLHRLFAETTLRSAIGHAHKQLVSGVSHRPQLLRLSDCAAVFAAAASYLEGGGTDTPLQDGSLVRLVSDPTYGWIWRDEHPDDPYGRAFRELISKRYRVLPSTPDDETIAALSKGAELLSELLPSLAPSALHHAHTIACVPVDKAFFGSSSRPDLGGIFFLRDSLGSPWWIAEHMLHEATHLKLYDLLGDELLQADGRRVERPVLAPWNPSLLTGANWWHAWRVMAAFHVYVHLALLAAVAEQRAAELEAAYGPVTDLLDSRRAMDRAGYLGHQLRAQPQCWETLGEKGQQLALWLQSLLDALDPDPAPDGATCHLYLDRYHRETARVEQMLAETPPRSLREGLDAAARTDVAAARAILRELNDERQLATLAAAVADVADDVVYGYPDVRRTIEACLREVPRGDHRAEAMVGRLVEDSSDRLYALSARIPEPVAHAKRRLAEHRDGRVCPDELGRYLAVLAAQTPIGATVLHTNAGVGVVIAWLVAGLGARDDAHVFAVETDETLCTAARMYPWPTFVRIDALDAMTALADHPRGCDLIVTDTSAWTADGVDAVIDALRPGGTLVFTHIQATPGDNPVEMRRAVTDRDDLMAAEIDWATGLLIATKMR